MPRITAEATAGMTEAARMPEITEAAEAQDHLKLKEDEQLDDLQNGFFIIQGRKNFRYGMDAVLLADFARAFNDFIFRKQKIEETRRRYTRIERERETMESRMAFIRDTFVRALDSGDITEKDFRELIPQGRGRSSTIVSFTSLLQMMRDRYLDASQKENYGDITVRPGEVDIHTYNAEAASQDFADEQEQESSAEEGV